MADKASKVMFDLVHEFWWPVTVELPADGGGVETIGFEARFRLATDDALLGKDRSAESGIEALEGERQVLRDHVTGWRGLVNGDLEIGFDAENLDWMLAYGPWRRGMARAFWAAHVGGQPGETAGETTGETARVKN